MTTDTRGRPLRNLRLSVTDRCNLRCHYCMPEENYRWLPRNDLLRFEEISVVVDAFTELGVDKVRITGGEPLLRRDLPVLVKLIAEKGAIRDLALTTNGIFLRQQAQALADAGLHRMTISLDTLQAARFEALTRRDSLLHVLGGIDAARRAGFSRLKINTVVMRGINEDELVALLEYGKRVGAEVRFIEYMDVGGATQWSMERVVAREDILQRLTRHYGAIEELPENSSAPAERFVLPDGTVFGIISSTTAPFCRACDRSRLTADGMWYLCLYANTGTDLRTPLRNGESRRDIAERIAQRWLLRGDRGAEERLAAAERSPQARVAQRRGDPHCEMHTRGG